MSDFTIFNFFWYISLHKTIEIAARQKMKLEETLNSVYRNKQPKIKNIIYSRRIIEFNFEVLSSVHLAQLFFYLHLAEFSIFWL